jgi:hypothetical protein
MLRKKLFLVLILISISVVILTIVLVGGYLMGRERATEAAKQYVAEQFAQEMHFLRTERPIPIVDGTRYRSYFFPANDTELIFFVEVLPSAFEVRQDSYYFAYFAQQLQKYFADDIYGVWGETAHIEVIAHDTREATRTPDYFDRKLPIDDSLDDMALVFFSESLNRSVFHFVLSIDVYYEDEVDSQHEANRIFSFIQILQLSGFQPSDLILRYNNPNPTIFERIIGETKIEIIIRDWSSIETIEQIQATIEEYGQGGN